jgi:hypothetical protein
MIDKPEDVKEMKNRDAESDNDARVCHIGVTAM